MHLDPGESRRVEVASRTLDGLPANASVAEVFGAIRPCVDAAAGLFTVIRPGAEDAMVSQPVGLPPEVFGSWLSMPPELLQRALAPVVSSKPGKLWRDSDTLRGVQRKQIEVLHKLDKAGLGEGAGYKILERRIPRYEVEHIMLALLMERGMRVPARSEVMLAALHKAIRAAVLRLSLPLLAHQSIYSQIVAEQSLGYICLSLTGRVIEANRRARHLIDRYKTEAGIRGLRGAVEAFAMRAQQHAKNGQPWQLRSHDSPSLLQVDAHRLAKETHVLPEDTLLLCMREVPEPPSANGRPALGKLTPREQEIALLLVQSGRGKKEIASQLEISANTMRTHTVNIYKKLEVGTRAGLIVRLRS